MSATLTHLSDAALKAAVTENLEKAKAAARPANDADRDLTGEERAAVKGYLEAAETHANTRKQRSEDAGLLSSITAAEHSTSLWTPTSGDPTPAAKSGTPGERFLASPAWKGFMGGFPDGRIPDSARGLNSGAVQMGGMKSLLTGASPTSAGALVQPQQYAFVDEPYRPLTMRQLVTNGTTTSDTIEYVRQGVRTNNAAFVAEAASAARIGTGTGEVTAVAGGLKPESGFELIEVSAPVRTIAHWEPATKRALSDAGQITTLIDNFLRAGLEEKVEDGIVSGDGNGQAFRGILSTDGTTAQPFEENLLVTTRRAKTKVRVVGRATPTAYVFNPEDNEKLDLMRETVGGTEGAFLFGGPASSGVQTLWGIPRIESEAVPVGTGILADWRQAVLWDREQATVQVSDSHADFFVRNLVAFLAEMRAAFGILRPSAFVEIDLSA